MVTGIAQKCYKASFPLWSHCKKALKFVLLDNYFPDLFTEVQICY